MFNLITLPPGTSMPRTARGRPSRSANYYHDDEKDECRRFVFAIAGFSSLPAPARMPGIAFVQFEGLERCARARKTPPRRSRSAPSRLSADSRRADLSRACRRRCRNSAIRHRLRPGDGRPRQSGPCRADRRRAISSWRWPRAIPCLPSGAPSEPGRRPAASYRHRSGKGDRAWAFRIADIDATLSAAWGGTFVNNFIDRDRVKRVYIEGDAPYRMTPDDLDRWYVRSATGTMAPFSSFATRDWTLGPTTLIPL